MFVSRTSPHVKSSSLKSPVGGRHSHGQPIPVPSPPPPPPGGVCDLFLVLGEGGPDNGHAGSCCCYGTYLGTLLEKLIFYSFNPDLASDAHAGAFLAFERPYTGF
jgi:hypothetical protein